MSAVTDQPSTDHYIARGRYPVPRGERTGRVLAKMPLRASFGKRPRGYRGAHRAEVVRLTSFYRRIRSYRPTPATPLALSNWMRRTGTGWPEIPPSAGKINFLGRHGDTPPTSE